MFFPTRAREPWEEGFPRREMNIKSKKFSQLTQKKKQNNSFVRDNCAIPSSQHCFLHHISSDACGRKRGGYWLKKKFQAHYFAG